jgi:hypothetical protein
MTRTRLKMLCLKPVWFRVQINPSLVSKGSGTGSFMTSVPPFRKNWMLFSIAPVRVFSRITSSSRACSSWKDSSRSEVWTAFDLRHPPKKMEQPRNATSSRFVIENRITLRTAIASLEVDGDT